MNEKLTREQREHAFVEWMRKYGDAFTEQAKHIFFEGFKSALTANTEPEDEHVFCPTCKAEVQWVKGWYDCDSCGQLKEHPLMDTEPEDEPLTLVRYEYLYNRFGGLFAWGKIEEYQVENSWKFEASDWNAIHRITNWLQQEE